MITIIDEYKLNILYYFWLSAKNRKRTLNVKRAKNPLLVMNNNYKGVEEVNHKLSFPDTTEIGKYTGKVNKVDLLKLGRKYDYIFLSFPNINKKLYKEMVTIEKKTKTCFIISQVKESPFIPKYYTLGSKQFQFYNEIYILDNYHNRLILNNKTLEPIHKLKI